MVKKDWKGMFGSPLTVFTKDNKLDEALIRKQIDYQVDAGIHLMCFNFHMNEIASLSFEERQQLAKIGVDQSKHRGIPSLVHMGYSGTDLAVKLAKAYDDIGADAVCMCSPYPDITWQRTDEAYEAHLRAIAEAVDCGVFVYNNPWRTGYHLNPALIGKLTRQIDNLVGMKEASESFVQFSEFCRETKGTHFAVFGGVEYMFPSWALGGKGAFAVAAPIAPKKVVELYDLTLNKKYAEAMDLQQKLLYIWHTFFEMNFVAVLKAAMEILGKPIGLPRRPAAPLDDAQKKTVKKILEETGILKEAYGW